MKKKQVVVRTYPSNFFGPDLDVLQDYLNNGYAVVMCNPFDCGRGQHGNEYILEKEIEESEE